MLDFITVGVTGVHVASAPKSGAVVLKELISEVDIKSVALVDYPQTCALGWGSTNLAGVYQVPQGILGSQPLTERVLEIHQRAPIHTLIPCDDEDVAALADSANVLADHGVSTLLPSPASVASVSKADFHETMSSCGISVPRQETIWDLREIAGKKLDPPLIVKGRLINAYLARNNTEVQAFAGKLSEVWGFPIILQEYVDGTEYSVTALADRNSALSGICAIRKLGISDQGKTWLAVTISPESFVPIITALIQKLEWVGPLEMEFIVPSDGSKPIAIEVNPRFPAWIPVARAAGANLIRRTVDLSQEKKAGNRLVAQAGMCFARNYYTNTFSMRELASFYAHQEFIFKEHLNNGSA